MVRFICLWEREIYTRVLIKLKRNWRKDNEPIAAGELSSTMEYLYDLGVNHIAYYPDNVYTNVPNAESMKQNFAKKPLRMYTYPNR